MKALSVTCENQKNEMKDLSFHKDGKDSLQQPSPEDYAIQLQQIYTLEVH